MGKRVSTSRRGRAGKRKGRSSRGRRGLLLVAVAAMAFLLHTFFIQTFRVPSRSMENTLLAGDYLLIDKFSYGSSSPFSRIHFPGLKKPAPGDILVFNYPLDPRRTYAKRCIATAGQTVEIRNKVVYVDGVRLPDPPYSKYVDPRIIPAAADPRDNFGPEKVPVKSVFVLGDNRDNSRDSRHWGMLSVDLILGSPLGVFWSCEPDYGRGRSAVAALFQGIRWKRLGRVVR